MSKRVSVAVVAVMLLLAALIGMPVLQLMRESERRVNCSNHLKVLGMALGTFHETQGHFPPGTVPNPRLPPERRLSWVVSIWPYSVRFLNDSMDPKVLEAMATIAGAEAAEAAP